MLNGSTARSRTAEGLSPGDLATLSLQDLDQGVCPNGHRCRSDQEPGFRVGHACDYRGFALVCWNLKPADIDAAEKSGSRPNVIAWARSFLGDRS